MVTARLELEVVLAALQVAVVGVEQAPRVAPLGVGFDESGDGGRGLLERLGDPIGFQQHLGGGGDQRPAGLDRAGSASAQNRDMPGRASSRSRLRRPLAAAILDVAQQRPLHGEECLVLSRSLVGSKSNWPSENSCSTLWAAAT